MQRRITQNKRLLQIAIRLNFLFFKVFWKQKILEFLQKILSSTTVSNIDKNKT